MNSPFSVRALAFFRQRSAAGQTEVQTEKKKRTGKFEITTSRSGQFRFNLKAANGEIILTSQMYESKAGAENGIASVRANAADDSRFERNTSSKGDPYFNLKAANGQVIGRSEMYSSASAMENGIASVRNNATEARVEDLTAE